MINYKTITEEDEKRLAEMADKNILLAAQNKVLKEEIEKIQERLAFLDFAINKLNAGLKNERA